jgi:stage IV sporulation protein FB
MVRFRLFGIPFEVGPYFWLLSAILGSNQAQGQHGLIVLVIWVACVFVSIVAHELGHALLARRFGLNPYVALHWLGGTTYMPGSGLTRPQSMLVTLAGPAAGLAFWALTRYVLVGLFIRSAEVNYVTFDVLQFLLFINLVWTLFNLLPVLPLDGGQFVRSLAGPRHLFFARMLGGIVAVIVCLYCVLIRQYYAAFFLGMLAFANFRPPVNRGTVV